MVIKGMYKQLELRQEKVDLLTEQLGIARGALEEVVRVVVADNANEQSVLNNARDALQKVRSENEKR